MGRVGSNITDRGARFTNAQTHTGIGVVVTSCRVMSPTTPPPQVDRTRRQPLQCCAHLRVSTSWGAVLCYWRVHTDCQLPSSIQLSSDPIIALTDTVAIDADSTYQRSSFVQVAHCAISHRLCLHSYYLSAPTGRRPGYQSSALLTCSGCALEVSDTRPGGLIARW